MIDYDDVSLVLRINKTFDNYIQLKQQILENQEKAEKLDECLRNPSEVMQWSGNTISRYHLQIANNKLLEQENKQLKEENQQWERSYASVCNAHQRLEQKLEKIEELYSNMESAPEMIGKDYRYIKLQLKKILENK